MICTHARVKQYYFICLQCAIYRLYMQFVIAISILPIPIVPRRPAANLADNRQGLGASRYQDNRPAVCLNDQQEERGSPLLRFMTTVCMYDCASSDCMTSGDYDYRELEIGLPTRVHVVSAIPTPASEEAEPQV